MVIKSIDMHELDDIFIKIASLERQIDELGEEISTVYICRECGVLQHKKKTVMSPTMWCPVCRKQVRFDMG